MISTKSLQTIIHHKLESGVNSRHSEYHLANFAYTTQQADVKIDTVVLRAANDNRLIFHTDIRSEKIAALQQQAKACMHFYSSTDKLQISCQVNSTIHHDNDVTAQRWANSRDISKQCYRQKEKPLEALPKEKHIVSLTKAYQHFAVVECIITSMDVLWLNINGNRRFIVQDNTITEVNP